jgi:hypothetical protein
MTQFRMDQIKVEQFAILENNIPHDDIGFSAELTPGASKEDKVIAIRLKASYTSNEKLLLVCVVSCVFKVEPDSWKEWEQDNQIIVPRGFIAHLAMHTFGTARGILFSRTEGTPYQRLILPPTNVDAIIKEDFIIEK